MDGQSRAAVASVKKPMGLSERLETGNEARAGIGHWIGDYNADRPHSAFGGRTPDVTKLEKPS